MTIVTSRFAQATDAIVTALRAAPALASPVVVQDGPSIQNAEWDDCVYVGFDGDWGNTVAEAVVINQVWPYIGVTTREETSDITCAIVSQTGDDDIKGVRDRAVVLLAAVETVLRTDPTLGIDGSTIAQLSPVAVYQETTQAGLACRVLFTISVKTTLTSST